MKFKKFKLTFLALLVIIPFSSNLSTIEASAKNIDIVENEQKINSTRRKQATINEEQSAKDFYEYLEPVYSDYQLSEIQTFSSDSTKDEYESNNSFEKATIMNNGQSINATLHRDPWYYLFWRDIDEDYYRIDVLGDAKLEVKLTNVPYGCDYDIELYKHFNGISSSFDDVTLFDTTSYSRKAQGSDEQITRNVTPNTYYIRVYPYGDKSYDADNKYKLTVSFSYQTKNETYSNLRYNLGAGGAIWLSDYDPCGIKAFSTQDRTYVGYHLIDGLTNIDVFSNPIFDYLGEENKVEHATLYLWDNNWKLALKSIVEQIRVQVQAEIAKNQKIQVKLELLGDAINIGGMITGVVLTFMTPTGGFIIASQIIGVIASVAPTIYGPIMQSLFPEIWDTTKEKYLNYLNVLSTALATTSTTSDNEIVKISTYYKITYDFNAFSSTFNYYCDYTPEYDETGYKYDDTTFYAFHPGQIFNGKIYGIVKPTDFSDAVNRKFKTQQEINTGGDREIFIGDGIIDELDVGEYHWFHFIAPVSGYYRFYSEGDTDTYLSMFNQIVPSQSSVGELKHDDDSGNGYNFSLTYKLKSNQVLYLRVRGYNWNRIGLYHFKVEAMENVFDARDTIILSDYGFKEKYDFEPITTTHSTENGLEFDVNRLRCGIIDKKYLALSAKRKDAGLAYIEYEFYNVIYSVDFDLAIWSEEEYLNKESSIAFDYKDTEGKWRNYMYFDIANLSKSKDALDHFSFELPEDAYGFRFVIRTNDVNYEQNKGRVVLGDISILYANV